MLGSANIGFTATNLGLIWKKNNVGIDPDFIPEHERFADGADTLL